MQAMEISRTGLDVEWRRLEVIAANLANANSVALPGQAAYQPMRLLSGPGAGFSQNLKTNGMAADGVTVYGLEPVKTAQRRVHEPANPAADAEGYVTYPGVDHTGEMTLMVKTARAYEANLVAMSVARQMYSKAMEIGRR